MTLLWVLLELLCLLSFSSILSARNISLFSNELEAESLQRRENDHVTGQEKKLFIDFHNMYRRNVSLPAANMQYIEWDNNLARIAQEWADKCKWKHGKTSDSSVDGPMGQNLYKGYSRDPKYAIKLWFDEYPYYNFHNLKCQPGQQCGHYTQVVWAESRLIGCALKIGCWTDYKYYIVCNYYPAGNFVGRKPYKLGLPCSQCYNNDDNDGSLCSDKLCVTKSQCSKYGLKCDCNLNCYNCGLLDKTKCKCDCKDGWDGPYCSSPCADERSGCKKYMCSQNMKEDFGNPCRKTCGLCKAIDESNLSNTCCDGARCPYGYVLDFERPCSCKILCPGPKCELSANSTRLISAVTLNFLSIIFYITKYFKCI